MESGSRDAGTTAAKPSRIQRLRWAANLVNGSTLLGLVLAKLGGATISRRQDGLLIAEGYRLRFPTGAAFTVGNLVLVHRRLEEAQRHYPRLMVHESRHANQYALLGTLFLPLYTLATAASWLVSGDRAAYNPLERMANLSDGGYPAGDWRPGLKKAGRYLTRRR